MKVAPALRILAVICLLASMPVACVKYPWLPATAAEFVELQHDPYPWGTESYHEDRSRRLARVTQALLLYALGTASLVGFFLVATGAASQKVWAASWLVSAITSGAIAQFEQSTLGPSTDRAYVVIVMYLPWGISALCGAATLVTLAVWTVGQAPREKGTTNRT